MTEGMIYLDLHRRAAGKRGRIRRQSSSNILLQASIYFTVSLGAVLACLSVTRAHAGHAWWVCVRWHCCTSRSKLVAFYSDRCILKGNCRACLSIAGDGRSCPIVRDQLFAFLGLVSTGRGGTALVARWSLSWGPSSGPFWYVRLLHKGAQV